MPSLRHPMLRRLYADFFMPSRMGEYREMLRAFVQAGYRFETIASFGTLLREGALDRTHRYAILRQDVDTDLSTSRMMWRIESDMGIRATRYFRLKTLAPSFMQEIAEGGGEASYHYEELSTIAKQRGIRRQKDLRDRVADARLMFAENLARLRKSTGLPMTTVAAHGDFVNRALKLSNQIILEDHDLRAKLRIDHEAYDAELSTPVEARFCDRPVPKKWDTSEPRGAIADHARVISLLTHPRHWRANAAANLSDGMCRIRDGIFYTRSLTRLT